jgi:hypothetical protein
MPQEITSLEEMLDRIDKTTDQEEIVSLGLIVEAVGGRSFGPLLLVAGLIMTSPLSGLPGMPTCTGLLVLLIATQLLFGKEYFWLPRWMLQRAVERSRIRKALRLLRPPARCIGRWLRPRLPSLIQGRSIALVCIVIAICMPVMELVPFSAHGAGIALSAFALALIVHDGLLALIAFLATAVTFGLVAYNSFI